MKPTYMMSRKERRAAAHAAAGAVPTPSMEPVAAPETPTSEKPPVSEAQRAANRENAQASTGPTSEAGKRKVSQNALKTGLTGAQVLLPTDDATLYEALVNDYKNEFNPVGPEETYLLQSIVDCRWRLARIPGQESALMDLGRRKMLRQEPLLAGNPAPVFEMQIRLHMAKELRNLHLQENRLVRRREKEMKELRQLQATRKASEESKAKEAAAKQQPTARPANGFVFTPSQITQYLATLTPQAQEMFLTEVILSVPQPTKTGNSREAAA